jgi:alkylated DNA repair protein (DNA oxidative demethylase)
MNAPLSGPDGFRVIPGYFTRAEQETLVAAIAAAIEQAPLYRGAMPKSGKLMSVAMTNTGPLGWYTDQTRGYRYERCHPVTGLPWPPIPDLALRAWNDLADYAAPPEACLINYYDAEARMGLHRDVDEEDFSAPVVSLSLGDAALFRMGGPERKGLARTITLNSGDAVVIGGPARRYFHGIDRVRAGSSTLLPQGGRFNLTLRRVTRRA